MKLITLSSGSCGNCHFLELNNKTIILDCGITFRQITHHPNFPKFKDISFVFITHEHKDHSKSMKEFKKTGCCVLTYEKLENKVQHWNIDNFEITTFPIKHNVMCFGIIIKSRQENIVFCYVTDFYEIPKIEGVSHFLFEVNYIESLIDETIDADKDLKHLGFNNHCSLEYAVDYFTRMNTRPKEIYCCHGSQSHSIKKKVYEGMRQFADKVVVL